MRNDTPVSATHQVYEIRMRSLGQVRVRGWYEKPLAEATYPALLRLPGYGSNMRPTGSSDPDPLFRPLGAPMEASLEAIRSGEGSPARVFYRTKGDARAMMV